MDDKIARLIDEKKLIEVSKKEKLNKCLIEKTSTVSLKSL